MLSRNGNWRETALDWRPIFLVPATRHYCEQEREAQLGKIITFLFGGLTLKGVVIDDDIHCCTGVWVVHLTRWSRVKLWLFHKQRRHHEHDSVRH